MTETVQETGNPHSDRTNRFVETNKKRCNFCKMLIVWGKTERAHLPVDYPPVTTGNVLLVHDDVKGLIAHVIGTKSARGAYQSAGWQLYQHHRLSCPHAEQWSGKLARKPAARKAAAPRRSRA
jgi:hypothetical protein